MKSPPKPPIDPTADMVPWKVPSTSLGTASEVMVRKAGSQKTFPMHHDHIKTDSVG